MSKSIEECIYEVLSNSLRISTAVSTRISPSYRPGTTALPCIVYEVSSVNGIPMLSDITQVTGECSVTVYAETVMGSIDAGDAVLDAMDGTNGTLDSTNYSFRFLSVSYDYEPSDEGDDFGVYSRELAFTFVKDVEDL